MDHLTSVLGQKIQAHASWLASGTSPKDSLPPKSVLRIACQQSTRSICFESDVGRRTPPGTHLPQISSPGCGT